MQNNTSHRLKEIKKIVTSPVKDRSKINRKIIFYFIFSRWGWIGVNKREMKVVFEVQPDVPPSPGQSDGWSYRYGYNKINITIQQPYLTMQ